MKSLMTTLLDQYCEEVEGVEEYSKCAMANKDDPELYKMYMEMAQAELGHAQKLQAQVFKRTSEELEPEEAKRILGLIWEEQKDEMVRKLAVARGYLEQVK